MGEWKLWNTNPFYIRVDELYYSALLTLTDEMSKYLKVCRKGFKFWKKMRTDL
jgi:hypothetical protein